MKDRPNQNAICISTFSALSPCNLTNGLYFNSSLATQTNSLDSWTHPMNGMPYCLINYTLEVTVLVFRWPLAFLQLSMFCSSRSPLLTRSEYFAALATHGYSNKSISCLPLHVLSLSIVSLPIHHRLAVPLGPPPLPAVHSIFWPCFIGRFPVFVLFKCPTSIRASWRVVRKFVNLLADSLSISITVISHALLYLPKTGSRKILKFGDTLTSQVNHI